MLFRSALEGHANSVASVAFSPDAKSVVSGSVDRTVRLWDAATDAPLQTLEGHSHLVRSVAFSSDGKSVVSGSVDRTVRLWDVAMGAPLQTLEGHANSVASVAFTGIGVQGEWILREGHKLLWLAQEYRTQVVDRHKSLVCLGLPSGRVITIGFKPDFTSPPMATI